MPHDILIYCPNFLVLGMQSGQMNYFKASILRGFFYNAINITFRSPSIFYIYIYIYIYSLTSQNSYNDLPTKLLGALFVKVFH